MGFLETIKRRRPLAFLLHALAGFGVVAADGSARFASREEVVAWLYCEFGWECLIARFWSSCPGPAPAS